MFLTFQSYDFDAFGAFGCRRTVQNFMKIVRTVFEKFEIFMKRSVFLRGSVFRVENLKKIEISVIVDTIPPVKALLK